MSVSTTSTDTEALRFAIVCDFAAPPERVWQVWADPRQLERWWGPPTWPATVTEHSLVPGGQVSYYMTGPDGERAAGWWEVIAVDEPYALEFEDGFADADGIPDLSMPVIRSRVTLEGAGAGVGAGAGAGAGTRMTIESTFASEGEMRQLLEMGAAEGMGEALGQIDGILAS